MTHVRWFARTAARLGASLLVPAVFVTAQAADATYTVVDLATLQANTASVVRGPNGRGHAWGGGKLPVDASGPHGRRGLILQSGAPVLHVPGLPGADDAIIFGMNDAGDFVGSSNTATAMRAIAGTAAGGVRALAPLAGDTVSAAFAVNHQNQSVGFSSGASGQRAVTWSANGTPTALPVAAGTRSSRATGINTRGDVVGVVGTASNRRPVIWEHGRPARELMLPAGQTIGEAYAINARGDVVGYAADASGLQRATLWPANGGVVDLGTLPEGNFSQALGSNDAGDIVGAATSHGSSRAILWTGNGGMQDLNTLIPASSSFVLTRAVGINNAGVIVATGYDTAAAPAAAGERGADAHELPVRVFLLLRSGGRP